MIQKYALSHLNMFDFSKLFNTFEPLILIIVESIRLNFKICGKLLSVRELALFFHDKVLNWAQFLLELWIKNFKFNLKVFWY